jgi:hypothetical protein
MEQGSEPQQPADAGSPWCDGEERERQGRRVLRGDGERGRPGGLEEEYIGVMGVEEIDIKEKILVTR